MAENNWADRLAQRQGSLSRKELDLVEWILSAPHEAAFDRLQDLADKAGVSKPTLISCYRQLGYDDYQSFQGAIQEFYAGQIDSYRAGSVALKNLDSIADLVKMSLDTEAAALESLRKNLDPSTLETFASALLSAKSIFVYGAGTGFYPGHYLVQRLRRCGLSALLVGTDREHLLDELWSVGEGDLFLSFYYTQDKDPLRNALDLCAQRDARRFLVMGFLDPELCSRSSLHLFVPRGSIEFKNSMAVPMAFAQILLMAVEFLGGDAIAEELRNLEITRKGIVNNMKERS